MKLPISLLLYLASAGLFGVAGWTFYEILPLWKESVRQAATSKGQNDALDRIQRGKGQGPVSADWQYTRELVPWWEHFKEVNLIGKLPPPPPEQVNGAEKAAPPPPPVRPLEEIIELVSIMYDGQEKGLGGNSYVIVRYKPEADVEPPEWYVREHQPPASASSTGAGRGGPADVTQAGAARGRGSRAVGRPPSPPVSAMPTSTMGREVSQTIWVKGGDDPRRSSFLFPKYDDIQLVRVAPDAQSAFFVRKPRPAAAGEEQAEPKEEELLKTSMNLSQDVLRELRRLQGREGERVAQATESGAAANAWREVEETTRFGNEIHISKKDEARFREHSEDLYEQVNLDTWVSRESSMRGLIVRNIDPQLKSRFGIAEGEVLLEVNGREVVSKSQALQFGKADYKRGVRTFTTKWLANGQIIERVYQAPNK